MLNKYFHMSLGFMLLLCSTSASLAHEVEKPPAYVIDAFGDLESEYSVQRRPHNYYTSFDVLKGHIPVGTIIQNHWRQFFRRHYVLHDVNGDFETSAVSRFWSLGLFSSVLTVLDIQDRYDRWYKLEGVYFTLDAAKFILRNEAGVALVALRMDRSFTGCQMTSPENRKQLYGDFYRSQITNYNVERWNYAISGNTNIAELEIPGGVWAIIAAFFSDVLDPVNYQSDLF